jgi:uncharacterized protein YjiS (DUF1127 family)
VISGTDGETLEDKAAEFFALRQTGIHRQRQTQTHGWPANVAVHKPKEVTILVLGGIREEGIMKMFFSTTRQMNARERKIATLRSMSAADLADIGIKPADVARIERELRNSRKS